ncbi:MAG TPA: SOS response-associated peptidase family protein [Thermomonas sp.]|nr:SOS response-associated peptidase family protein [Thermomonas sp.]
MCYSAQALQDYRIYVRTHGAALGLDAFIRLFWDWRQNRTGYRLPKAMLDALADPASTPDPRLRQWIQDWTTEQANVLEQELFAQMTRRVGAERALQARVTKKAQQDLRIASDKIARAGQRLKDLRRSEPLPRDSRIFPGSYSCVMVAEGGRRVVYPMRYQCRPQGKPAAYDRKYPGTYNARRDSLEGYWEDLFGHHHAVMQVDTFYENVEAGDGRNRVLQFTPRDGGPMYVACLWSRWTDPAGTQPDLLSFAAITDEPEPEVAAAGHDRTIINLKPECIDAWLNPDPRDLPALYALFDDRQHPYYEHREAA